MADSPVLLLLLFSMPLLLMFVSLLLSPDDGRAGGGGVINVVVDAMVADAGEMGRAGEVTGAVIVERSGMAAGPEGSAVDLGMGSTVDAAGMSDAVDVGGIAASAVALLFAVGAGMVDGMVVDSGCAMGTVDMEDGAAAAAVDVDEDENEDDLGGGEKGGGE